MIPTFAKQALKTALFARRKKLGRAARGKPRKSPRWLYPWGAERRYAAAIRAWLKPMMDYVHEYLKNNQEAILRGDSASLIRQDEIPGGSYRRMVKSLYGWFTSYLPPITESGTMEAPPIIYAGLGSIAESMAKFNSEQWAKAARAELGVEFPVYETWWPEAKATWQEENYRLIQNVGDDYIKAVNRAAEQAVTNGMSVGQLAKEIRKIDDKIKSWRVNLIARDQIGKLNGQVTQARMAAVGLELYEWSTSADERVRDSHEVLDGKVCQWDDPTVYSEDGGKTWKDRPSDWCQLHPGYDIACRCTALSYWEELVNEVDKEIDEQEGINEKLVEKLPENENNKGLQSSEKAVLSGSEKLAKAQTLEDLASYASDEWGVKAVNLDGLDADAVKGIFEAMDKALSEHPELKGQIAGIGKSKAGIMSSRMFDDGSICIYFNPGYYSNIEEAKKIYAYGLSKGYYPEGTNWTNAGVHELGHVAHGVIAKNNPSNDYLFQAAIDFNDNSTAKRIVAEAWNNVKKEYPKGTKVVYARRGISEYAGKNDAETIAEAFSDVFRNKDNAKPLSLEIVRLLKKELK